MYPGEPNAFGVSHPGAKIRSTFGANRVINQDWVFFRLARRSRNQKDGKSPPQYSSQKATVKQLNAKAT